MDEVAGIDPAADQHPGQAQRVGRDAGVERELGVAEHRQHVGQVRLRAALEREPQLRLRPERRERGQDRGVDARRERAETVAEVAGDGGQDALGGRVGVGEHLCHGTTVLRSRPSLHGAVRLRTPTAAHATVERRPRGGPTDRALPR